MQVSSHNPRNFLKLSVAGLATAATAHVFLGADSESYAQAKPIEIGKSGCECALCVVEIDNAYPSYYQVLEIDGYTKYDEDEDIWEAYFPDERLTTSVSLINSSLLTIEG